MVLLNKKVFKNITLFELLLFLITSILGISLFIWQILETTSPMDTNIIISYSLTLIDIPIGVIAAIGFSKKWKYSIFLLAIDAVLYGVSNFLSGNISLGIVNALLIPFLWMFAFFYLWRKSNIKEGETFKTRKLSLSKGLLLVSSFIVVSTIFALLISNFGEDLTNGPKWLDLFASLFDSFSASLMLIATIMAILRYRETWFLYFFSNVLKIILFTMLVSYGNFESLLLLILAISYAINSLYGMLIWKDSTDS